MHLNVSSDLLVHTFCLPPFLPTFVAHCTSICFQQHLEFVAFDQRHAFLVSAECFHGKMIYLVSSQSGPGPALPHNCTTGTKSEIELTCAQLSKAKELLWTIRWTYRWRQPIFLDCVIAFILLAGWDSRWSYFRARNLLVDAATG